MVCKQIFNSQINSSHPSQMDSSNSEAEKVSGLVKFSGRDEGILHLGMCVGGGLGRLKTTSWVKSKQLKSSL